MCKTVLLFLDSVERADDGKRREPYLAWNWELAGLMENKEMYKRFELHMALHSISSPLATKGGYKKKIQKYQCKLALLTSLIMMRF